LKATFTLSKTTDVLSSKRAKEEVVTNYRYDGFEYKLWAMIRLSETIIKMPSK